MDEQELKPCPFCGCKIQKRKSGSGKEWAHHPKSDCFMSECVITALDKWNRRAATIENLASHK
jgi:hypothetical protein